MFKRANKITSLLVAAAAVVSLAPTAALAADVKKIDSQDGTVYNAVAYKDGKAYIDGSVEDKDEAAYYYADGQYTALEDVDSGSDIATYADKYIDVQDGDYYVDLETGKVTDDSIADDARDDAAGNIRKKVKGDTDGRYLKDATANAADTLKVLKDTDELAGNKFAEKWYGVTFGNKDLTNGFLTTGSPLTVYSDKDGNYIDADYNLGKIKVTTTDVAADTDKSVYVENTDDTYDSATTAKVSAQVDASTSVVLGQDANFIYRKVKVTVLVSAPTAEIIAIDGKSVVPASGKTSAFTAVTNGFEFNAIQKISKAQASGDIGGAKYAKTVTTYVISNDSAEDKTADFTYDNYTVANGKVVGYTVDGSGNVKTRTATLKAKNGLNYTDLGDEASEDVEVVDNKSAVDVDADGNLWRLNGGYIYQWNNDEDWDKVYKVDGSLNELSVYDKDDIVAWNEDDEAYSVIASKGEATTPEVPATTTGWAQATNGTWSFVNTDGTKATGWLNNGGAWYHLNTAGVMETGWINDAGTWYFLNASGAMATGWLNDNGTWYYLNASGAMLANTTVDGYVLGASGAWVK